ncbi:MAG: gamma-glutamylcyclotransferase family protein [Gemmatimonadaceae bacterium]
MPLLFSYGTLQQESAQLSTLGRRLDGQRDELPRFEGSLVRIEDPRVVATTGKTHHANVTFNGNDESRVPGMLFEITDAELVIIDEYEVAFFYKRVTAMLASGRQAWVYVHGRRASRCNSN